MNKIFALSVFCLLGLSFIFIKNDSFDHKNLKSLNPYEFTTISYELAQIEENNWGVNIFLDGKLYYQKDEIEMVGKLNEAEAVKVATLLIEKIKNNKFPLDLTVDELNAMGLITQQLVK
jgi:hypothetical protein